MKIANPKVTVIVYGSSTTTIEDAYISFDIEKDLTEEENTADLEIANLSDDYQQFFARSSESKAPVDIYLTKGGVEGNKAELAFSGEIESSESEDTFPGNMTYVSCVSQRENHRAFHIQRSYLTGTSISTIMNDLVSEVGLPRGNTFDLPTTAIATGESFSGPAFSVLQRYAHDLGMYCYIRDGKLFLTDVFNPPKLVTTVIPDSILLGKPRPAVYNDRSMIEKKYNNETGLRIPFKNDAKGGKRRKVKRKRKGKGQSTNINDLIEYEGVDQTIRGRDFPIYASAGINPDDIVQYGEDIYRVLSLNHSGDNFGGDFMSLIRAVEYNYYLVYVPQLKVVEK